MMKNKVFVVLLVCILFNCSKQGLEIQESQKIVNNNEHEVLKSTDAIDEIPMYIEGDSSFIVTQESVDVYRYPDFKTIVGQLEKGGEVYIIGVYEKNIENRALCWLKIQYESDGTFGGWILSDATNIGNCSPSRLQIKKSSKDNWGNLILEGQYVINDREYDFSVISNNVKGNIYSFWWDHLRSDFHYYTIPGLYYWDENKKELEHISYIAGIDGEIQAYGASIWAMVTDDRKYLIQDYGTVPYPRGLIVWDINKGEIVFTGKYYEKITLHEHILEIVEYYGEYDKGNWKIINKNLNEDDMQFARNYMEKNKPPAEMIKEADSGQGLGLSFLLVFEYNLENKKMKIIGGKYVQTM